MELKICIQVPPRMSMIIHHFCPKLYAFTIYLSQNMLSSTLTLQHEMRVIQALRHCPLGPQNTFLRFNCVSWHPPHLTDSFNWMDLQYKEALMLSAEKCEIYHWLYNIRWWQVFTALIKKHFSLCRDGEMTLFPACCYCSLHEHTDTQALTAFVQNDVDPLFRIDFFHLYFYWDFIIFMKYNIRLCQGCVKPKTCFYA